MKTVTRKMVPAGVGSFWLVVLSVCFLVGGILGTAMACNADEPGGAALASAASGFLDRAAAGERGSLWPVLAETTLVPVIAFFCGFCVFGGILCGGLCLMQGFFLSFCTAILLRIQGSVGLAGAICFYGIPALLSVPVLLSLAIRSAMLSGELWRLSRGYRGTLPLPLYQRDCWLGFALCLPPLLLAGCYEVFGAPGLWKGLLAWIT